MPPIVVVLHLTGHLGDGLEVTWRQLCVSPLFIYYILYILLYILYIIYYIYSLVIISYI